MWKQILLTCGLALCALFASVTGLPQEKDMERIIGGQLASIKEAPFIAAVFRLEQYMREFKCGGSVISARHILTAAHCFVLENFQYAVRVGSENRTSGGIFILGKSFTLHPDFDQTSYLSSDIAILELQENIPFGGQFGIRKAILPGHEVVNNQMLTAFGWGVKVAEGFVPIHLHKAVFSVMDRDYCDQRVYSDMTSNMFCAKGDDTQTCNGDSGGPLAQNGIVHGISSYGLKNCNVKFPRVYTSVVNFVPWILSHIN